ncbi:MAG: phosphate acetyltransferase [Defluviitaleaceae bacterium]|nr:phosphate acetyltransferase [Defluviitaleaceae bacterium]
MSFIAGIKARAKAVNKKIVLPESYEARNLTAAAKILEEGIAQVILIGEEAKIKEAAGGLDISKASFIDPKSYEKMPELSSKLYELRKAKGLSLEEAEKLLSENPLYLGAMLVKEEFADGMVAGAQYATADVLRPALQILKTSPGVSLVSSFFIMVVPNCDFGDDGVFVFSDCGLVQNPNAEELAAIALSSAASFESILGKEARVAMLSHSTKGSAKHADVDKVVQATEIAKAARPDLLLDGELQLDAAIVPAIGASKAKGSDVAGRANVLIFPDLDSGNIGYKLVERLAKAEAFGPVTQGIAKPVNDLSRGCSADDIVGVVAITALQASTK